MIKPNETTIQSLDEVIDLIDKEVSSELSRIWGPDENFRRIHFDGTFYRIFPSMSRLSDYESRLHAMNKINTRLQDAGWLTKIINEIQCCEYSCSREMKIIVYKPGYTPPENLKPKGFWSNLFANNNGSSY